MAEWGTSNQETPATQPGQLDEVRAAALAQIKRKRDFRNLLLWWIGVTVVSLIVWAATRPDYFWPVWPFLGLGIGVAAQAWGIWGPRERAISDADIDAEVARMQGRSGS